MNLTTMLKSAYKNYALLQTKLNLCLLILIGLAMNNKEAEEWIARCKETTKISKGALNKFLETFEKEGESLIHEVYSGIEGQYIKLTFHWDDMG